MKYSILGFSQNKVLDLIDSTNINRNDNDKLYIDIEDLLILSVIADMSNRKSIRKVILDDGQYSWISYNSILEDLPIMRIGKKQLSRKLNKLVEFNLIELRVERISGTGTFVYIRLGKEYEGLMYSSKEDRQKYADGIDNEVDGGGQKSTPKDNTTKQDNNKEERDKSLSKKDEGVDYDAIVKCWNTTNTMLPQVRMLNKKRKDKIRTLLANNNANVNDLYNAIKIVSVCPFLCGNNDRGWTATFDWLINDTNSCFSRLLEGSFASTKGEKQAIKMIVDANADNSSIITNTLPKGWTQERYDMYIRNGYTITDDGRLFKDGKEYK